jgi:hypothetical protein
MRKDIKISFKDDPEEDKLYDDIIHDCKFIGKSSWMKLAAREKLERDRIGSKSEHTQKISQINQQSGGFINSLDDLFQK